MRRTTTPEGRVKARLNKRLGEEFGSALYRFMPVQNGMGAPALDYFCCYKGLFIAIETKVPGKNLSPRQEITAKNIILAGGKVFVARDPREIELLIEELRKL